MYEALLGSKSKDFITAVDEKNIIVVKGTGDERRTCGGLDKTAAELSGICCKTEDETVYGLLMERLYSDIKEVSKSYKEAKLALDVGRDLLR